MRWALVIALAAAFAHALAQRVAADDLARRWPVAVATADVHDGPAPLRVCFDGSKSYHPEERTFAFSWDFGDGRGTASEPKACHVYVQPGLYAAMMTVTDDRGLEDARVVVVSVREAR